MIKRSVSFIAITAAALALGACATLQRGPVGNAAVPEPVRSVDLNAYLGRWYEIGRYEAGFQRGCEASTATYTLRDDGLIGVVNTCLQGGLDGEFRSVEGKARVVEGSGGAKLEVSFFGPFYFGNYWILDHAEDYSWSIVGEGSGRYLWLLSRTPQPSDPVREQIMSRARELGYDLSILRPTIQPSEN
ncbi:lipocalin family protein [Brevundimonas sp. BAL450]|jgi:apolipoprotein D and lipocalin family protein|uniref:Outer membrane lipoprotein Blc n=1 Tax=Brevundimonas abyssalis TAR-001 TaxID=1391729 RepID=A0A8E0KL18_9CAUL|nr:MULTISPECIES: lipocalin family protein [Brevundimonas]MBG7616655.1 lipocalin family protein [Brevundimonas sp. BAL450]GAD58539.1 outer membrane lipoprotein [Brevundimonas abyssalis TAR-001]